MIPGGQTTSTITGTLINDGALDRSRTLTFTLGTPTNATLGSVTTNTLLIAETPPRASITYKTGYASVTEPAPGNALPYYFTIALDDVSPVPVTVFYQTRDGSAQAGEDYRGVNSYRVTFPAFAHGAIANSPPSQDVAITINGDASDGIEPETFSVVLTSAYNGTINANGRSATGTIMQATPQSGTKVGIVDFSAAGPTAGSTVFDVPITLTGPAAQPITVYYSTTGGTAKSGVNYAGRQGHVTIAAGQTIADIPIMVLADAAAHLNLTFTITIYNWVNAAVVSSTATVTIVYGCARIESARLTVAGAAGGSALPKCAQIIAVGRCPLEARELAPSAFNDPNKLQRCITADDYALVAGQHPQVQRAAATLRWNGSWGEILVAIDPLGQVEASQELLDAV